MTDKNTLTVTDAGYNADIFAGGTIVIGCNLGTTASKVEITSATLNGKKMMHGKMRQIPLFIEIRDHAAHRQLKRGKGTSGGIADTVSPQRDLVSVFSGVQSGYRVFDLLQRSRMLREHAHGREEHSLALSVVQAGEHDIVHKLDPVLNLAVRAFYGSRI